MCGRAVQSNQRGICCDQCDKWHHITCAGITSDEYTRLSNSSESWACTTCLPTTHQQYRRQVETIEYRRIHCGECQRVIRSINRRINCDQCNQWYHIPCVRNVLSNEDYQRFAESWSCPAACIRCSNRQQQNRNSQIRLHRQQEVEEEREHIRFQCGECHRAVHSNHRGICCDQCNNWFHARCANVSNSVYTRLSSSSEDWLCSGCHASNRRQVQNCSNVGECHNVMSQEQYLYSNGWQTETLHEQSWAQVYMNQFQTKQNQWQNKKCTTCNEQWPTRTHTCTEPYVCMRCQRDKHSPKLFSADNDMDPGSVPPCLQNMSQIEELLVARACPITTVYHKHGGQLGYSGHVRT